MKKSLFLTNILLLSSLLGFSQLPVSTTAANKNVVLEEYTGIYCVYCPDGHKIANQIKAANSSRVVLINVHTGGYAAPTGADPDFRTTFGTALAGQTGLTGYPSGTVNRHVFSGTATASSRSVWTANSTTILGQSSYANVALEGSLDVATRVLTVNTEVYITGTAPSSLKLNVALLQNNLAGPQTGGATYNPTQINSAGDYIHGHMLRHLITGQWGDTITTTSTGTLISRTYTYTIPADLNGIPFNLGDLELAAFIAEGNQEIITGANGPIAYVIPPGSSMVDLSSASAITAPSSYCSSSIVPSVVITNAGTNTLDTFEVSYSLNGGTPVTMPVYTTLAANASTTVNFPAATLSAGSNTIEFNCNVDNAATYVELSTINNTSLSSEMITVSNTAITGAVTEPFEGYVYATVSGTNSFALNPNAISAFILNTANTSQTTPIGGFGNSDGVFRWRFYDIAAGESSSILYDKLSFNGNTGSMIEFDLSYAQYDASSNDKLDIEISTDCGANWSSVYSKSGTTLSTNTDFSTATYYPVDKWRKETVDLSTYDGQGSVLIKFTGTSDYGNNLYIDNIRFVDAVSTSIDEKENTASLNLFPNPSNGQVTLNYASNVESTVSVSIINVIGELVYSENGANKAGSYSNVLDLSHLPKGVYMVNVKANNATTTKKLIIQ